MIDIERLIERLRLRNVERPDLDCDPDADISWAQGLQPPNNAADFAAEIIFVICNSGMRYTTARGIYNRVRERLEADGSARDVFGHIGKANAIDSIWRLKHSRFADYLASDDKLAFIEALPWIGGITKYHVAKNFGLPYAKPDVHLQRLADRFETTAQDLCEVLASQSGYSVATIDTLLWRAAAVGILDTSTGELR